MDKGIFYLICSIVIIGAVIGSAAISTAKTQALCQGKVVYQKQVVMVTPSPTATPSGVLKPSVFRVVATPTK